jgi:hypothetical protein
LNYAITGVVPQTGREFRGVADYYQKVRPYSQNYFRGRIQPEDEEAAEVRLRMTVGDRQYFLVRGMFSPTSLRQLDVVSTLDGRPVSLLDRDSADDDERHITYTKMITEDSGLEIFAQLVFLQHFVLTFDERRDLLFWGERTLPAALYMAFGIDPAVARQADRLQETVRKTDSLARNYSWQASDIRRQLETLEATQEQVESDDVGLGEQHRRLIEDRDEAGSTLERINSEIADIQLRIAERSARLREARAEYENAWSEHLQGLSPSAHPVVTVSIDGDRCALCGASGVGASIRSKLDHSECPLCGSATDAARARSDLTGALAKLDGEIVSLTRSLAASERSLRSLETQLSAGRSALDAAASRIAEFERQNELALVRTVRGPSGVTAVAERYRLQMAELLSKKQEQLTRRDSAQSELRALQTDLVSRYAAAEREFVPSFLALAHEFLGVELDIQLESRRNGVVLLLTVQGSQRSAQDDLSESQRMFLDIALRMALAQQMATTQSQACLYIDTPEGSLDIAYEARAGSMFAKFVQRGYRLVITANINTSQLLQRLAETCGPERMKLERMTEWATLTEVQSAEEGLFTEAYEQIVHALRAGNL